MAALLFAAATPIFSQNVAPGQAEEIYLIKTTVPPKIDGYLDEEIWQKVEPITDWYQQLPLEGVAPTEKTEIWLTYDEENLYVAGRFYQDSSKTIGKTLERDSFGIGQDDQFAIAIDSFHDRRNGFWFSTNPASIRVDIQTFDEGRVLNPDWDGIWECKSRIDDKGWVTEIKIPFFNLRFNQGPKNTMGISMFRLIKHKNEEIYSPHIPREYTGTFAFSLARPVHFEGIKRGRRLEIKPYALLGFNQNFEAAGNEDEFLKDVGLDLKYGITPNLTADITVNTDFAQVEADDQQINLTRFSLFFPEKRDFFLESAGLFEFGIPQFAQIFFSRRIGIESGMEIPLSAGGRVTGRVGKYSIGMLDVQTKKEGDVPSTNFGVVRVRRDVLDRSNVGFIFTNRDASGKGEYNRVFGADANFTFLTDMRFNNFIAASRSSGSDETEIAGRSEFIKEGDLLRFGGSYTYIDEGFNPGIGFLLRSGIKRTQGSFELRPRPNSKIIRRLGFGYEIEYLTDLDDSLLTRENRFTFENEFHSGEFFSFSYSENYERLTEDFNIFEGITIPTGSYGFNQSTISFNTYNGRRLFGNVSTTVGDFFEGEIKAFELGGTVKINNHLSISSDYEYDNVDLPAGHFTTNIARVRVKYAFTPNAFTSTLIQYNDLTDDVDINLRLDFIHTPGSDLFVVFNESRNTNRLPGDPTSNRRASIVKLTYLVNF